MSLTKATELAQRPDTMYIDEHDVLYQLRQLRSKFDSESTYFCCSAAGAMTNDHACRPCTVFTLADYDNGHDASDGRIGYSLFREIAISVIQGQAKDTKGLNVDRLKQSLFCSFDLRAKEKARSVSSLIISLIYTRKTPTSLQSLATKA
jgi:hypothetical protein